LINTCWFFFKIALALAIALVVAVWIYLYSRMDNEIRRQVEQTLAKQFPHLNVSVGRAALVEGRGIEIHDLVVSETTGTHCRTICC
jgi:ABC-type lipoprotein release transport system permease subunit